MLIACPECGGTISDNARACPHCGQPMTPAPPPSGTSRVRRRVRPTGVRSGTVIAFFIIGAIGLLAIVLYPDFAPRRNTPQPKTPTTPTAQPATPQPKHTKTGAYVAAETFVRQRLKAPATAKFPWDTEGHVKDLGEGRYAVGSYVDAQNVFGALLRRRFLCTVQYVPESDSWRCEEITIVGE